MAQERVTVMTCDAPGCPVQRITSKSDPAPGYYLGKGMWHLDYGGGPIPGVYACSPEHIGPAVQAVIDKAWRHDE